MKKPLYDDKIVDRQVGRNAQLFSQAIAELPSEEARFPYLRILVALIEQAHPELGQAPEKGRQIGELIREMSSGSLDLEEVGVAVQARDAERPMRAGPR